MPAAPASALQVRALTPAEHLAFVDTRASVSFLQTPAWGAVKREWRHESLGWFRGDELVGAGLVLLRQLPRVRRYLAYLPEGPAIDWDTDDLGAWLTPMAAHLRTLGAFGVRMGPPVVTRRWDAATVKAGLADDAVRTLDDLAPTERTARGARAVSQLRELGWRPPADGAGFAAGQPRHVFVVPLVEPEDTADGRAAGKPRSEEDVLRGMNQQWRRNIKRAAKEGVEVVRADATGPDADAALAAFHELYVHTAERDHFTPRPASYFRTMRDALAAEAPERFTLWLARHEGDLVAATIAIRVGDHAWYSYGASSTEKRDVRGSNAVQWAMMRDALAAGASSYDLRGITDTLDPDDGHAGLIQFKVGTGGEVREYPGEWDLPLPGATNRALYAAFDAYLKRRG